MAEKYEGIDFEPPVSVARAAELGLEYRAKQGKDKAGLDSQEAGKAGIGSGVQRASTLKNRNNVSPKVIRQMVAFFSRHAKNKSIDPKFKGEPWKDKGYVSWLLWGGDPGKAWAEKVLRQMEAADAKTQKKAAMRLAARYLQASFSFEVTEGPGGTFAVKARYGRVLVGSLWTELPKRLSPQCERDVQTLSERVGKSLQPIFVGWVQVNEPNRGIGSGLYHAALKEASRRSMVMVPASCAGFSVEPEARAIWDKLKRKHISEGDAVLLKKASTSRADLDRVLGGLLTNFSWPAAKQAAKWMEENLRKVFLPRTPRGGKQLKTKLDLVHHVLMQTYDNSDSRAQQVQDDIRELQPHFDTILKMFGEGHGKVIPKELRSGDVLYRNDVGFDEKKLKAFVAKLDVLWSSVKGWRRKAFAGGLTVVLSGPKAFRGTASGVYRSAQDEIHVRATPKVLKRSAGYGDPQYILIHELGHRYEYKVRGLPEDFDRLHWHTTRYSMKDNESFAELFALGHFGLKGNWDDAKVQRFEKVMQGQSDAAPVSNLPEAVRDRIKPKWTRFSSQRKAAVQNLAARYVAAAESKSQCMHEGCKKPPQKECIWADGRGRAWFCSKHYSSWKTPDKEVIREAEVKDGKVGEKFGKQGKLSEDVIRILVMAKVKLTAPQLKALKATAEGGLLLQVGLDNGPGGRGSKRFYWQAAAGPGYKERVRKTVFKRLEGLGLIERFQSDQSALDRGHSTSLFRVTPKGQEVLEAL